VGKGVKIFLDFTVLGMQLPTVLVDFLARGTEEQRYIGTKLPKLP
jgi:hypothetical protein